ncbi:MAG: SLC13 family permease, partial [Sporomusa sp.]
MSLGVLSLLGLAVAIVISCISENNIGLLAMGLSYIIGVQYGGMSVANIIKGFPLSLFLTLVGVTYLFTIALVNGTLEKLTRQVIGLARGHAGILPFVVFFLVMFLAAIGPGNIAM